MTAHPEGPPPAYPKPVYQDTGAYYPGGPSPSPAPFAQSPPPPGGYPRGPPPPQGYYPPQPGYGPQGPMYYGQPPPQQGYYNNQGGSSMEGICAGILGALACCCCLDMLF